MDGDLGGKKTEAVVTFSGVVHPASAPRN